MSAVPFRSTLQYVDLPAGMTVLATVLMGINKVNFIKTHYFHVITGLPIQKFHTHFKNDLTKFHTIP